MLRHQGSLKSVIQEVFKKLTEDVSDKKTMQGFQNCFCIKNIFVPFSMNFLEGSSYKGSDGTLGWDIILGHMVRIITALLRTSHCRLLWGGSSNNVPRGWFSSWWSRSLATSFCADPSGSRQHGSHFPKQDVGRDLIPPWQRVCCPQDPLASSSFCRWWRLLVSSLPMPTLVLCVCVCVVVIPSLF